MRKASSIAVIITAVVSVVFLSGCTDGIQDQIQNKVNEYSDVAEQKLDEAIGKVEKAVDEAVDEAITSIKKKLSDAVKGKIDEWLDQNLPQKNTDSLTSDDYAKLIQENPALKEILDK